jgi:hypothetical protein
VRLQGEDLRHFSDDALAVRLAGMRDAGDVDAVRAIAHEQERRRVARAAQRAADRDPDWYVTSVEDLPIKVHGRPLPDTERRELAAWVRMLAPEGVRRAVLSDDHIAIDHGG